jgi:hypothetical protein
MRKMIYAKPGLSLARELPDRYYFKQLAQSLCLADSEKYQEDHFYVYGWYSSKVRPQMRIEEGRKLYSSLQDLTLKLQTQYGKIYIRCIGFSHGGNVILNMLSNLPFSTPNVELEIVLLGTPIQESTRNFINSPYICRAYSVFSDADWIQKIDAQRFHHNCPTGAPFWSQRCFKPTDNVYQIKLKINGKSIGHLKYRKIMRHLGEVLKQTDCLINQFPDQHMIDVDYIARQNKKRSIKKNKKSVSLD